MAVKTEAQEEFDNIFAAATGGRGFNSHPVDRENDDETDELDEETTYQQRKVDENMRVPVYDRGLGLRLPPPSFDSGRTTGVKGVIADARSFVETKREGAWKSRNQSANRGKENGRTALYQKKEKRQGGAEGESYYHSDSEEDEEFLEQWREARRKEILREGNDIRNRRTSPSMRRYGRFDEVDALGYLDAIEKVGRETVVVVFVYDVEVCEGSSLGRSCIMTSRTDRYHSVPSAKSSRRLSPTLCPSTLISISSK